MKIALLCYHKNADTLYQPSWIQEYKFSILNQSIKDFDIFELNYSGLPYRIFETSNYHSMPFPSFVYALNFLLDHLFFMGYDCVFNTNVDDTYSLDRIEKQLPFIGEYDIVSSNFVLTRDGKIVHRHFFDKVNIEQELSVNHNPICHPAVCYSKSFWERHRYIPEQQPLEDLMLWQRAIKDSKFKIVPDVLVYHRLHDNSVCQSENR